MTSINEVVAYQDALWECYKLAGEDTDGDEGPGALIAGNGPGGFARIVVEAVRELRQEYDEALRGSWPWPSPWIPADPDGLPPVTYPFWRRQEQARRDAAAIE